MKRNDSQDKVFSKGLSSLLAVGREDGRIEILDLETGELLRHFGAHAGAIYDIAFHPEGARLASASVDTSIRIWDHEEGLEVLRLEGHESYVRGIAFSPDGRDLASASGDNSIRIWSTRTERERTEGSTGD